MSDFSERYMRGENMTRRELMEHVDEIHKLDCAYSKAMAARDKWQREMERCTCDWSGSDDETAHHVPPVEGCPVHPKEE